MSTNRYSRIKRRVPISEKQEKVLIALKDFIAEKNKSPTFRELTQIIGARSHDALVSLRRRGIITWDKRTARSLSLVEKKPRAKSSFSKKEASATENIALEMPERPMRGQANTSNIVSLLKSRAVQIENELKKILQAIEVLENSDL